MEGIHRRLRFQDVFESQVSRNVDGLIHYTVIYGVRLPRDIVNLSEDVLRRANLLITG